MCSFRLKGVLDVFLGSLGVGGRQILSDVYLMFSKRWMERSEPHSPHLPSPVSVAKVGGRVGICSGV